MSLLFPKNRTKRLLSVFLTICITAALILTGCSPGTGYGQNKAFRSFTKELFCREVSSNTISLHYSLKNPEKYGIKEKPISFGDISSDSRTAYASLENLRAALGKFSYDMLSEENQLTYDVLDYYLQTAEKNTEYLLYQEPLGLVGGIQTQLPVLLSEYQFYNTKDVDTYEVNSSIF